MKRALSVVLGVGLAAVVSSPALALGPETLKAHIPFAFSVDNVTLPPGDYRIKPLSDLSPDVVVIRSTDGRHAVVAMATDAAPAHSSDTPQLVFDHLGKREFLRAVRVPDETGADLPSSRTEIDAARAVASHSSASHKVTS
jgi:hypothetical protein